MRVCAFVLMFSVAAVSAATAQSLADVARKESERRQTVSGSGKTYTNQDLKPVPEPAGGASTAPADSSTSPADAAATLTGADGGATPSDAAADTAADTAGASTQAESDRSAEPEGEKAGEKNEEYWSKRMAALRERLERDQTFADALQNRIDALTIDFVNRDDPAQRAQIANDRQKALAELDRVKKSIEQGKRAIPELEEEARRAGVPAGWLR